MAQIRSLPRICIALGLPDVPTLLDHACREAASGESFLEFRLDFLDKPHKGAEAIRGFVEQFPDSIVVATCRRHQNHGKFNGSIEEQLAILDQAVRNGAQLLAVPANNATFNRRMSEQQLAFAKVRAVEHDRYVVVAGTTGISSVIAPDGAELVRTGFFEPGYLDIQVRLKTQLTPATRWGPIVQWLLVLAAGAAILVGIRHNGWFPRPVRPRSRPFGSRHSGESDASGTPAAEAEGGLDLAQHAAPDEDGDHTPPEEGGDETPPDEGGPPSFGRHRGAT